MRKISFLLLLLFTSQCFAQSADKGRINIYSGIGMGLLKASTNLNLQRSESGVPRLFNLSFDYNTHNQVSLGLEMHNQNFIIEDSSDVDNMNSNMIGLTLKFHLLNREKSSAYIGTSVGGFNFEYKITDSLNNTGKVLAKGIYNMIYLGFNKYFGKVFGLYVKAGLLNQPMQMSNVIINGEADTDWFYKDIDKIKMFMLGGFVNLGIVVKLNN